MYGQKSFSDKIKDIFFNHRDRFSRETFTITFTALLLFMFITTPFVYKLCSLFLPKFMIILLAIAYVVCMIYSMFVLSIKRLHDLNITGWLSILILIFPLNMFFWAYLCLRKGDPGTNNYGNSLEYEGPSFILFLCYAVLCLYAVGTGVGLFYAKKLRNIQNTVQGAQKLVSILPKKLQEEVKESPRVMGALFVDNQFTAPVVSITENRVLVRGVNFKQVIQAALSQKRKVEIRFPDNSLTNVTKFIVSNDSMSVQMAVFEIDKPIGTPAKLSEKNRQLLENMNAF